MIPHPNKDYVCIIKTIGRTHQTRRCVHLQRVIHPSSHCSSMQAGRRKRSKGTLKDLAMDDGIGIPTHTCIYANIQCIAIELCQHYKSITVSWSKQQTYTACPRLRRRTFVDDDMMAACERPCMHVSSKADIHLSPRRLTSSQGRQLVITYSC